MITKYKINKNELILNINYLYKPRNNIKSHKQLIKVINLIINKNNIKFKGNKIIIYLNGLFLGEIILINYYLKNKNYLLSEINTYFNQINIIEINKKGNVKKIKLLHYKTVEKSTV